MQKEALQLTKEIKLSNAAPRDDDLSPLPHYASVGKYTIFSYISLDPARFPYIEYSANSS